MYEREEDGVEQLVSQNVIPHKKYFRGAKPFAFTETGVAMLSSVLNSERAVGINIAIMRTFIASRKIAISHQEIMLRNGPGKNRVSLSFGTVFIYGW